MNPCIFCQIVNKDLPASIVYEDHLLMAFMDIDPLSDGHVLIVTKAHRLDLDHLSDAESSQIMKVSKSLLKALRQVYDFPGYTLMQNGGAFNDVGHYHMHIFPRYHEDGFSWQWKDFQAQPPQEEALKLRQALSQLTL